MSKNNFDIEIMEKGINLFDQLDKIKTLKNKSVDYNVKSFVVLKFYDAKTNKELNEKLEIPLGITDKNCAPINDLISNKIALPTIKKQLKISDAEIELLYHMIKTKNKYTQIIKIQQYLIEYRKKYPSAIKVLPLGSDRRYKGDKKEYFNSIFKKLMNKGYIIKEIGNNNPFKINEKKLSKQYQNDIISLLDKHFYNKFDDDKSIELIGNIGSNFIENLSIVKKMLK